MIYLDSSALMKLVRAEDETDALQDWLARHPDEPTVSSELARVEVLRAAARAGRNAVAEARAVLADLDLVPLDRTVQDLAGDIGGVGLRTLDALHLASAVLLGDSLTAMLAYDLRLVGAAQEVGIRVASPGQVDPT